MAAGDFARAVTYYRELVTQLPNNLDLRMNLGLALHSAGRYREAAGAFKVVVKARPTYSQAWLFLGLARAKMGEAATAIAPLQRAVETDPGNRTALLELGDAYLESGRPGDAAATFERLTILEPNSAKAWQALALSYNARARQSFDRLEKAAPESSYWYALAARSKLDQRQYPAAFYLYKRALDAEPRGLAGVHAGLAEVYRQIGQPDWAILEDSRETGAEPPATGPSPERAAYDAAREDSRKALEAFAHLSQLSPTAEIHGLLGQAERLQGHYVQAEQEYREALRMEPANRQLQKDLAQTLWLAHDFDGALPMLGGLLALEPSSAELNFEIGDTWLEKNEAAKALPFLAAALKLDPGALPAHGALGKAFLQLHRPAEAIPHLKAVLAADKDGSAHYQLARAYRETGQEALARQASAEFRSAYRARQQRQEEMERESRITAP